MLFSTNSLYKFDLLPVGFQPFYVYFAFLSFEERKEHGSNQNKVQMYILQFC